MSCLILLVSSRLIANLYFSDSAADEIDFDVLVFPKGNFGQGKER